VGNYTFPRKPRETLNTKKGDLLDLKIENIMRLKNYKRG